MEKACATGRTNVSSEDHLGLFYRASCWFGRQTPVYPLTNSQVAYDLGRNVIDARHLVLPRCGTSGSSGVWQTEPAEEREPRLQAARRGIADTRGSAPQTRSRSRCVVKSLWQPARVPADMRARVVGQLAVRGAPERTSVRHAGEPIRAVDH
jgi:hypothetical protein